MDTQKRKTGFLILAAVLVIVWLFTMAQGCTEKRYIFKVTFADGSYDYFELPYKPKQGAKSIDYHGETILGVDSIIPIK